MGKKSILTQILIYGVISALVVLVDYVTLWLLTEKVGVHYILSAAIGFSLGLPVSYFLGKHFVFKESRLQSPATEFIAYSLVGVVGLGLTELFMWLFTDIIGLHYMLSKAITLWIVFSWNFSARRFLVFKA